MILAASSEGDAWVWDPAEVTPVAACQVGKFGAVTAGLLGGQPIVATGKFGKESPVQLRRLADGSLWKEIPTRHERYITSIAIGELRDGCVVATGGSEGDLRLWNPDGELVSEIHFGASVQDLAFGKESTLVVSTSKGVAALGFP
jgi:WD40 repeat protein